MSLFFIGGQDWEVIDKALAAFSNAVCPCTDRSLGVR
jgi:hypothetical protein